MTCTGCRSHCRTSSNQSDSLWWKSAGTVHWQVASKGRQEGAGGFFHSIRDITKDRPYLCGSSYAPEIRIATGLFSECKMSSSGSVQVRSVSNDKLGRSAEAKGRPEENASAR